MSDPLTYLDARVMLGPGDFTREGQPTTADALLDAMDHFGIHEALVRHSQGDLGDAEWANEKIVAATREHDRLHPVWTVMPPQTGELVPPRELVERMRDRGVAAAWLPYGAFAIPLEEWCLAPRLEPFEEAGVPLFLCPNDSRDGEAADTTDWPGVVRVCQRFPGLPVIVTESRLYKSQRAMCAALAACPNLRIDVSTLWLHRLIEFLCERFGADRLVWSSQLPYRTPGATLMQLNYAEIGDAEKARIAGGNMRELIAWNESVRSVAADVAFPEPTDALHRTARERADLSGYEFHDCHGHIGGRGHRHIVRDTAAELVREMDRHGVRTCCLFTWMSQGDVVAANEIAFQAVEQFPDRFVGFTALNPNHGEAEARSELERGLARGMRGIKMVSSIHKYPPDGPLIDLACRFAHEHGLFFLDHVWGPPDVMRHWLETYPDACFLTGHADARYVDLVREFGNLFICTCPFLAWGQTERFVDLYGADRLLFGSDLQDLPIGWGLGPVMYAKIPEADKRLILGDNLKRLLGRYGVAR